MNKTEKSHQGDHNTLWTLKILDFNYFTDNTLWNFEYHRFSNTWVLTIGRLGAMEIFIVWSLLVDVNTNNFLQKKATKNSSPVIYPPYPTFSVVHINIYLSVRRLKKHFQPMQVQDEAQAGEITNFAAAIKSIQHLTMFKTLKNQLSFFVVEPVSDMCQPTSETLWQCTRCKKLYLVNTKHCKNFVGKSCVSIVRVEIFLKWG